jgi:hypothetical protein
MLPTGDVLAWTRAAGGERLLLAVNMAAGPARLDLAAPQLGAAELLLSSDPARPEGAAGDGALALGRDEAVVARLA